MGEVIKLPTIKKNGEQCCMCNKTGVFKVNLVDEYGRPPGAKYFCEDHYLKSD